ncbi:hypothetical protein TTRE_0000085801 [Trichuris trichiura]|uniref:Uncharacterized protein n=1 Tax=Trichuris trichiura TaxID=36087 RepID=A0A077YXW0_TRITR|nr:hypothetical protein TTRE_0000085801 [Trichuris trichiura]
MTPRPENGTILDFLYFSLRRSFMSKIISTAPWV